MEAGIKLHLESVTLASACCIYHRFFAECELSNYDPYLIGATAIYLATKVEEQHVKLRDIINVCYRYDRNDVPCSYLIQKQSQALWSIYYGLQYKRSNKSLLWICWQNTSLSVDVSYYIVFRKNKITGTWPLVIYCIMYLRTIRLSSYIFFVIISLFLVKHVLLPLLFIYLCNLFSMFLSELFTGSMKAL